MHGIVNEIKVILLSRFISRNISIKILTDPKLLFVVFIVHFVFLTLTYFFSQ